MSDSEILQVILAKLDHLEKGQQETNEQLQAFKQETNEQLECLKKDVRTLKHDVKEIAWKVDTLYDWVDGLDLKLKEIDNRTA